MLYRWQGRLVSAPVWLAHEDQVMNAHRCWSRKNKVTECTDTKCTDDRQMYSQTDESGSVSMTWRLRAFTSRPPSQNPKVKSHGSHKRTSKCADSFPRLELMLCANIKNLWVWSLNAPSHLAITYDTETQRCKKQIKMLWEEYVLLCAWWQQYS